jgi:hypothetical protein
MAHNGKSSVFDVCQYAQVTYLLRVGATYQYALHYAQRTPDTYAESDTSSTRNTKHSTRTDFETQGLLNLTEHEIRGRARDAEQCQAVSLTTALDPKPAPSGQLNG